MLAFLRFLKGLGRSIEQAQRMRKIARAYADRPDRMREAILATLLTKMDRPVSRQDDESRIDPLAA